MRITHHIPCLILSMMLLGSALLQAQNWADSVYVAFYNNQTERVFQHARKAISAGQATSDTYYKLGIMEFNQQRYGRAAYHLQRAYADLNRDPVYREYLYYAYLWSGFTHVARAVLGSNHSALAQRVGYKPAYFSGLQLEAATLLPAAQAMQRRDQPLPDQVDYFQATYFDQVQMGSTQFYAQPIPQLTITLSAQHVINKAFERLAYNQEVLPFLPKRYVDQTFEDALPYLQAQLSLSYQHRTWSFQAAGSWFASQYMARSLLVIPAFPNPPQFNILEDKISKNQQSATLGIQKRQGRWLLSGAGTYTNLADQPTWITEAGAYWFPTYNNHYFVGSQVGRMQLPGEQRYSVHGHAGARLTDRWWVEAYGGSGQMQNYIGGQGGMVFNTPQPIQWYSGVQVHYNLNHWLFTLGGGLQQREGTEYFSRLIPGSFPVAFTNEQQQYSYQYYLIKTKITWTW